MKTQIASEVLAQEVLRDLTSPAIHFDGCLLEQMAKEEGGFAVMAPSRRRKFQLPMASPVFFGITSEVNSGERESHHFHPHQVEIYVLIRGAFRMKTWLGFQEREFVLESPGDTVVVPPGSCHHLCEWLEPGVAYVFRSPNDITGEAAKILCDVAAHQDLKRDPVRMAA
jgi:mannose-6-phosphate isomerase-like protein (cupin superfamily)